MVELNDLIESRLVVFEMIDPKKEIRLRLERTTSTPVSIILHNVERFFMTEVREQNVIEQIVLWKNFESAEFKHALLFLVSGKINADQSQMHAQTMEEILKRLERNEVVLLSIDAIFGAQLVALAKSMEIV